MAQARLIVEHSTAALSGRLVDAIFFLQVDDVGFPDSGWRDNIVVVLSWWTEAVINLISGDSETEKVRFMEGPYAVEISRDAEGLWFMRCLDRLTSRATGKAFECRTKYSFDDIGNRTSAAAGGDVTGANLRTATYGANALNQDTNRAVPGYVNVIGNAGTSAVVTVWGSDGSYSANSRKDKYYRGELVVDNSTNALWLTVTNVAVLPNAGSPDIVTNTTGTLFAPKTAEAFHFDADGNQLSDGRWTYAWNGENRLIQMVSLTNAPSGSKLRLNFSYDSQGRRITKQVESWSGSAWSVISSNKFLYDGWNLIAELNGTNNAVIRSYMWGTDLSGGMQGSGGVGGLIALNDATQGVQFVAFDANGNVVGLVKADNGTASANYEYGPFGELIKSSGPMAKSNPLRFSTKYQDDDSEMIYYGYRDYSQSLGRWNSRDPYQEFGAINLYLSARNDFENHNDMLGEYTLPIEIHPNADPAMFDKKEIGLFIPRGLLSPGKPVSCVCAGGKDGFRTQGSSISFTGHIYIKKGHSADGDIDKVGQTIYQHEMGHAKSFERYLTAMEGTLKTMTSSCLTPLCYKAWQKIYMTQDDYWTAQMILDAAQLDCASYGGDCDKVPGYTTARNKALSDLNNVAATANRICKRGY